MEISVKNNLATMEPVWMLLEGSTAFVTEAGRDFYASMVMLCTKYCSNICVKISLLVVGTSINSESNIFCPVKSDLQQLLKQTRSWGFEIQVFLPWRNADQ